MNTYKALAFDPDTCLEREFAAASVKNVTIFRTDNADQLRSSVTQQPVDLLLLHLELPEGISGLSLLSDIRKYKPNIPALLLANKQPSAQVWMEAAGKPLIELMRTPINAGELQFHLARLCGRKEPMPLPVQPVEELRSDKSGRLDVNKISDVFGLTVADIARCVERPPQTLHKTPDSISLQPGLHHFERIAHGLITVTGSIKGLKMWLNSPNPEFKDDVANKDHTPLDVLKLGKAEFLADLTDDARLGHPS